MKTLTLIAATLVALAAIVSVTAKLVEMRRVADMWAYQNKLAETCSVGDCSAQWKAMPLPA